ncbi:tetratricopeptide repeat protein [Thauera aromatica]|nr:tetratricopeptide repeat protein [Thauera aromatica]MCK2126472.1 tetratricopeptide repeat protein [Thauera aromatica]
MAGWKPTVEAVDESDESRLALANALISGGRIDEGVAVLRALIDAHPGNTKICLTLAQTLWRSGRKEEAGTVLIHASEADPLDHRLAKRAAQALIMSKDYERAEPLVGLAIALDAKSANAYLLRAMLAFRTGDLALAEKDCHHALELEPEHKQAARILERVLRRAQRGNQAQETRAKSVKPELVERLRNFVARFRARLDEKDFPAAEALLKRLDGKPRLELAKRKLQGDLLLAKGDTAGAAAIYREVLRTAMQQHPDGGQAQAGRNEPLQLKRAAGRAVRDQFRHQRATR